MTPTPRRPTPPVPAPQGGMARRAVALLLPAALALMAAAPARGQEQDLRLWHHPVLERLQCQCGCMLTVGGCDHQVCSSRDNAKRVAYALIQAGLDEEAALRLIAGRDAAAARAAGVADERALALLGDPNNATMGPHVMIDQPDRSWVRAALLVGGVVGVMAVIVTLLGLRLRRRLSAAAPASAGDDALDREIERRLREIE